MKRLVFAPHADDEILGMGGAIRKFIKQGENVYVCIVTKGNPKIFRPQFVEDTFSQTLQAHSYLGVKETTNLEFPCVTLNQVEKHVLNGKIEETVERIRPEYVYLPHFGDMHIDHRVVAEAVLVACRPLKKYIKGIYSYETLSETEWNFNHSSNAFLPNYFINITDTLEEKMKAMSYIREQLKEFPHPRSLEAMRALAEYRGATIGERAAEAFCVVREYDR